MINKNFLIEQTSQQQVANHLRDDLTNAQQVLEDILKECSDNESESDEDDESLVSCESIFIILFRF